MLIYYIPLGYNNKFLKQEKLKLDTSFALKNDCLVTEKLPRQEANTIKAQLPL